MSVGIISIYDNDNIGNKLQNYALQKKFAQYTDNVLTIKNQPFLKNPLRYIRRHSALAESVAWNRLIRNQRKVQFLAFDHQHIRTSRTAYLYNLPHKALKLVDRCDLYCAGSDQIWNPDFERHTMFNYLGFTDRERTFSYAASFGLDEIPEEHKASVRKGLQHIKYISVREDAGKRIVEELTGRTDVQVLVDPTMLLTAQEWDQVAQKPKTELPGKYLLTYFLGEVSNERRQTVLAKAEELGCELIELMDKNGPFYEEGPGAFIYLIKHATAVCTDSFHASVFSFLYERPLAIMARQGEGHNMGSRMETLAGKFSLRDCIVQANGLLRLPEKADYSFGYTVLEEERRKAMEFLDMVFQEARRNGLCN